MNKFFPNIETAIIVVFIFCVMLWGASRCKRQKDDLVNKTVTEGSASLPDTLASPAAAKPMPKALPPLDPAVTTTTPPPQYSPTPPANPGQALPQPVPQQNTPNSYSTPPPIPNNKATTSGKSPSVTRVETSPATTVTEPTGSALYVLRSGLNVRAQPTVKSKSLGKLKLHDQVYFLDEVSQTAETVRLENGAEITKPWFKVKTKRGTVGWVHGSGVDFYKRKPQDVF
jgi:Bacterial SH3 domain